MPCGLHQVSSIPHWWIEAIQGYLHEATMCHHRIKEKRENERLLCFICDDLHPNGTIFHILLKPQGYNSIKIGRLGKSMAICKEMCTLCDSALPLLQWMPPWLTNTSLTLFSKTRLASFYLSSFFIFNFQQGTSISSFLSFQFDVLS